LIFDERGGIGMSRLLPCELARQQHTKVQKI
jgi:hypothetical protein